MVDSLFTSNSKLYFLYKLFGFLIILFIIDFTIGYALRYLYFHEKSGNAYSITYALERTHEDIIILGDSQALHSFDPRVFSDVLGLSCYNAGRGGQSILYFKAILDGILKRYTPKIVIINVPPYGLFYRDIVYDRLSMLLPYYKTHKDLRPIIELRGPFEKYKNISKIYPFNSTIVSLLNPNIGRKKAYAGFIPLKRTLKPVFADNLDATQIEVNASDLIIDPNLVNAFESMIRETLSSDAELFLVMTPVYRKRKFDYNPRSKELVLKIIKKYNVPFWDYYILPEFYGNYIYFADNAHLNYKGAEIFSKLIAERIREYLINKNTDTTIAIKPPKDSTLNIDKLSTSVDNLAH